MVHPSHCSAAFGNARMNVSPASKLTAVNQGRSVRREASPRRFPFRAYRVSGSPIIIRPERSHIHSEHQTGKAAHPIG